MHAHLPSTCIAVGAVGPSTGVLYKVTDGNPAPFPGCLDFGNPRFEEAYAQKLRDDKRLGAEYVTFQIFLPPHYLNSAGAIPPLDTGRQEPPFQSNAAVIIPRLSMQSALYGWCDILCAHCLAALYSDISDRHIRGVP